MVRASFQRGSLLINTSFLLLGAFVLSVAITYPQDLSPRVALRRNQNSSSTQVPEFQSTSRVVLTDFVVRDKHQRPVKDLKPAEVEILEDGVSQRILSFDWVDGRANRAQKTSQTDEVSRSVHDANSVLRDVSFVTIVYDNMSPGGRIFAARVVKDFLSKGIAPNIFVGMFSVGYHLIKLQGYTNDAELLEAAADRAAMNSSGPLTAESHVRLSPSDSSSSGAAGRTQRPLDASIFRPAVLGSAEERGPETDRRVAALSAGIERLNTLMVNQVYGSTMMDELNALIRQQAALPGRKTILFLSEGLTVAAEFPERFRNLIGTSNRANITFNTVNCKGLTTENRSDAAARWAPEQVGKWDVDENLRDLADETGGVAMDNSNDLRQNISRAMEAVRSHYEVTYQPQSELNDGRYRKLSVKVRRPGVRLQSRGGYYALPWINGALLFPFEMAALTVVNTVPAPHSFSFDSSVLRFGDTGGSRATALLFEVPARNLRIHQAPGGKTFQLWVSFFGLVKGQAGNVVARVSRDFTYTGPAERREGVESGVVSVTLPLELSEGHYTIDSVVIDREAARASTLQFSIDVTSAAYPYLSDIVLVRRTERIDVGKSTSNPLEANGLRITPEITPAVAYAPSADLMLYLIAFPRQNALAELTIDFTRNGHVEHTVSPVVTSEALSEGIPVLVRVPMASLSPGRYEVTATLKQDDRAGRSVTHFSLN